MDQDHGMGGYSYTSVNKMILQVKNVQNSIYFFGKYKTLKTLKVKSCMTDDLGSELQSR